MSSSFSCSQLWLSSSWRHPLSLTFPYSASLFSPPFPLRHLPGMSEICSSLLLTTGHLTYFTVLITAVFSFFLRISLNYFHFSISQLNKIPRILSMIGPFVCEYHQWVIGTYLATAIFVLPLNWELFRVIGFLGVVLIGLLLFYGSQKAVYNLSSGVIVASIFLICILFIMAMWIVGWVGE